MRALHRIEQLLGACIHTPTPRRMHSQVLQRIEQLRGPLVEVEAQRLAAAQSEARELQERLKQVSLIAYW